MNDQPTPYWSQPPDNLLETLHSTPLFGVSHRKLVMYGDDKEVYHA